MKKIISTIAISILLALSVMAEGVVVGGRSGCDPVTEGCHVCPAPHYDTDPCPIGDFADLAEEDLDIVKIFIKRFWR